TVANVLPEVIPREPVTGFVEAFFGMQEVAERATRGCPSLLFTQPLLLQAVDLELQVGLDFGGEVAGLALAPEHRSDLFRCQNALDRGCQPIPLGGFFCQLFAAGCCQGIEPGPTVAGGNSPLGGDPAALFQALKRGIESAVLDEQLLLPALLDGTSDALAVLGTKDEGAKDQQIKSALKQFETFRWVLGRHITREYRRVRVRCQPEKQGLQNLCDDQQEKPPAAKAGLILRQLRHG